MGKKDTNTFIHTPTHKHTYYQIVILWEECRIVYVYSCTRVLYGALYVYPKPNQFIKKQLAH